MHSLSSPKNIADEGLTPSPTAMDEGPSLQEINPDSTAFVAPEVVSDQVLIWIPQVV